MPLKLGRIASNPRCVSCTKRTSHFCFSHNSASSCYFAADMPSMLIDVTVNGGSDKVNVLLALRLMLSNHGSSSV